MDSSWASLHQGEHFFPLHMPLKWQNLVQDLTVVKVPGLRTAPQELEGEEKAQGCERGQKSGEVLPRAGGSGPIRQLKQGTRPLGSTREHKVISRKILAHLGRLSPAPPNCVAGNGCHADLSGLSWI